MSEDPLHVPVLLGNGARIRVEASRGAPPSAGNVEADVAFDRSARGEVDVAFGVAQFDEVAKAIEGIAESLTAAIERIAPKKTTVEFGIELQAESGTLTALVVKGSGKANLKVTMEWS